MGTLRRALIFLIGCTLTCYPAFSAEAESPTIGGVPIFPSNNVWNKAIDSLPIHLFSQQYIKSIGHNKPVHPDFGSGLWDGSPMGIPINVVPPNTKKVSMRFQYADESDSSPYPIPDNPKIEGGAQSQGDRHILILDKDAHKLYEIFKAVRTRDGSWQAGSGAIFDLQSNALRPDGWTSADAAGLPIMPGLVRYDEVARGEIKHALRFTAPLTQGGYAWPAKHRASRSTDTNLPPMGIRFRLRANFDESTFPKDCQVILRCLKIYGMILADNGSSWYISGMPDEHWNNDSLHQLSRVTGSDFEAIDESSLMIDRKSAQSR